MKQQGFGKDDLKPQSEPDIEISTEIADKIILEVLTSLGTDIAGQAGLPVGAIQEGETAEDHFEKIIQLLATVGVQLELAKGEVIDGKPTMDVLVKQTVGSIDLSEAVVNNKEEE